MYLIFVHFSLAYQPFVRSCRERHVCPFFHTLSHLRISPYYFYVGRVFFIMMRSNDIDFSLSISCCLFLFLVSWINCDYSRTLHDLISAEFCFKQVCPMKTRNSLRLSTIYDQDLVHNYYVHCVSFIFSNFCKFLTDVPACLCVVL